MAEQSTPAVPASYVGLWKRSGIWRSNGSSDLSTQVWWFQSPRFHIDLRIPVDRPMAARAADLIELDSQQFDRYAAQTGFAGTTVVNGMRCEWQPEIAFPAVSSEVDAGIMRFDAPAHLHESGIDGSYEEDWVRIEAGPVLGLRLEAVRGDAKLDAIAFLLLSENWLAWAVGIRNDAFPRDASAAGRAHWSEFSFAQKVAAGQWRLLASNNPWREGQLVSLALDASQACAPGQFITLPPSTGIDLSQQWRISDISAFKKN